MSEEGDGTKFLDELTESEWVKYDWYDNTDLACEGRRRFIRGNERSPVDAPRARAEWRALRG